MANCKLCESKANQCGRKLILDKYDARYLRCSACDYVWVESPHWLDEAYSNAIAALDTGIVVRNLWLRDACCALLGSSFRDVKTLVDHGGGTGLFVRLMRDRGHDAYWSDKHCDNLLARGFDADPEARYDLLTAFELVEHLEEPMVEFQRLYARAPRLLISTELQPSDPGRLMDWHYLAPEAGQHIGFFTRRSLEVVAERLGLVLSSNNRNLHVLAPDRVSDRWLYLLRKPAWASKWARMGSRKGLAHRDTELQLRRLRGG